MEESAAKQYQLRPQGHRVVVNDTQSDSIVMGSVLEKVSVDMKALAKLEI